jgi:polar amino acid transport system substrate-binding protein
MHTPPFAIRTDDGHWSGLSIELLQQMAGTLGVEVEWREYDYDLQGLLYAVEHRHLDAAIAVLPMTATYEEDLDFSHAYFRTGLGIAAHRRPPQPLLRIFHGLVSWQFLGAVASLVSLLLGIGTLIWLLERRRNPHHFRPGPVQGIADGVWWSAVTMTTVGYGDKTPITGAGRLVSLVWMFGSIFFLTFFAAVLASSFTAIRLQQSVDGPQDLAWVRVAVVAGTRGEELLVAQGSQPRPYPFVIQACKALHRGEVEAVVYNKAILEYMIKDYGWKGLAVLPQTLLVEDYALVFPSGSPLREPVNHALRATPGQTPAPAVTHRRPNRERWTPVGDATCTCGS